MVGFTKYVEEEGYSFFKEQFDAVHEIEEGEGFKESFTCDTEEGEVSDLDKLIKAVKFISGFFCQWEEGDDLPSGDDKIVLNILIEFFNENIAKIKAGLKEPEVKGLVEAYNKMVDVINDNQELSSEFEDTKKIEDDRYRGRRPSSARPGGGHGRRPSTLDDIKIEKPLDPNNEKDRKDGGASK